MKIKEKFRIGGMIHKKYGEPKKTAFTRLIDSPHLTEQQKDQLREQKAQLNPFELKKNLEIKLEEFYETYRKASPATSRAYCLNVFPAG